MDDNLNVCRHCGEPLDDYVIVHDPDDNEFKVCPNCYYSIGYR